MGMKGPGREVLTLLDETSTSTAVGWKFPSLEDTRGSGVLLGVLDCLHPCESHSNELDYGWVKEKYKCFPDRGVLQSTDVSHPRCINCASTIWLPERASVRGGRRSALGDPVESMDILPASIVRRSYVFAGSKAAAASLWDEVSKETISNCGKVFRKANTPGNVWLFQM